MIIIPVRMRRHGVGVGFVILHSTFYLLHICVVR